MALTKVTYSMIDGAPYNVLDYGADPTGSTDSTAAIIAALAAGGSNCAIYLPTGTYKVTSQILINQNRVHIYGDGEYATTIQFTPTANSTCFKFEVSGTTINQGSICNLAIRSDDNTYVKTALHFVDLSGYYISNVVIGGGVAVGGAGFWTDPTYNSKGIYIQGRDSTGFNEITCFADKPIVVDVNPNSASISIDHFNFNNMYLGGTYNPLITFLSGVVATQVTFTGYQAWVLGEGGFKWSDATTPGASNGIVFQNVRYENNRDPNASFIQIVSASGVQNVQVIGGQAGYTNGFYFDGVNQASIDSFFYSDPTGKIALYALNCYQINIANCYWNTGTTASYSGMIVQHKEATWTSGPLPSTGYILKALANTKSYDEIFNTTLGGDAFSLNAGAYAGIGGNTQTGFVMITASDNSSAIFTLDGTNATTHEISDWAGLYSTVKGTANSYNIYWEAGNNRYEIENGFAASKTIRLIRFGKGQ